MDKTDYSKGDTLRKVDKKKFDANYTAIFGEKELPKTYRRRVYINGVWYEDGTEPVIRKKDNVNMKSESSSISPTQVSEYNKLFKDKGSWANENGTVYFKDRQSKLQVLRERNLFDKDEIRSPKN